MSWRTDITEPVAGWLTSLYPGLGVKAVDIRSTGTSGPSLLYVLADLNLPIGDNDEWSFQILDYPSAGTLVADENGDFTFDGAPAGYYKVRLSRTRNGFNFGDVTHALVVGSVPGLVLAPSGRLVIKSAIAQGDKLIELSQGRMRSKTVPSKLTILQNGRRKVAP